MSDLKFAQAPVPSWARVLPTGGEGGVNAIQVDGAGAGTRSYAMWEWLLPMGRAPSVRVAARVKSTIVSYNKSFEGVAIRIRGKNAAGQTVWESKPEQGGSRIWYSEAHSDWRDAVWIIEIPRDEAIESFTLEVVVNAGGQITICKPECRYHYAITYRIPLDGQRVWTDGFSFENLSQHVDTENYTSAHIRYTRTEQVDIRQGKFLSMIAKGSLLSDPIRHILPSPDEQGSSPKAYGSRTGIMAKYRRRDTTKYDLFVVAEQRTEPTAGNKSFFIDGSNQIRALYDYSQVELIMFCNINPRKIDASDGAHVFSSVKQMGMRDVEFTLVVADYIEPTQ